MIQHLLSIIFTCRNGQKILRSNMITDILLFLKKPDKNGEKINYLFSYKDINVKDLIWEMKYPNNKKAYYLFAHALHTYILQKYISRPAPIHITNIPISKQRLSEKGFDHINRLCKTIEKISSGKILYKPLCKKSRHTKRQAHIKDRNKRKQNISGSFEIITAYKLPQSIIIIDDVYTSGSTINEVRNILKSSGVNNIECITIAH